jgi:prevent-host-death family protein
MTRISKPRPARTSQPPQRRRNRRSDRWALQDAKARFSELVRRVRSEGPQHVTVHGRDAVVIVTVEDFRRIAGGLSGESLVAVMGASPYRKTEVEPARVRAPVRGITL